MVLDISMLCKLFPLDLSTPLTCDNENIRSCLHMRTAIYFYDLLFLFNYTVDTYY